MSSRFCNISGSATIFLLALRFFSRSSIFIVKAWRIRSAASVASSVTSSTAPLSMPSAQDLMVFAVASSFLSCWRSPPTKSVL